uniref:Reverse transcriptase domain-containing protein n=1 Tax=Bracon brevicornis TaxID=1563983 RepID=A0A6V7KTZ8_9HYME
MSERERLYRVYRRTKSRASPLEYRAIRDKAHAAIEGARQLFYQQRLSTISDPAHFWKDLRSLGIIEADNSTADAFSIEDLNSHFAGVSYDASEPSVDDFLASLIDEPTVSGTQLQLRLVTADEVRRAVNHFTTGARGVDGIPASLVKAALPSLLPHLLLLFNTSLSSCSFPCQWRRSIIIALNKVKNPSSPSDFRPIALLCMLSEVLEKLVALQITAFLAERNILDTFQAGFRRGHSTEMALLRLNDDIRIAIDRREMTMLLLFDFSKAFDSVCHVALLTKLRKYGFSLATLQWIASYLSSRSQATTDGTGKQSSFLTLNKGVPQGSVLGPLLFLLFINDVLEVLPLDVHHLIYADDLQVYLSFIPEDLEVAAERMGNVADWVSAWAKSNRLLLNVSKTKSIICGSQAFVNRISSVDCFIGIGRTGIWPETHVRNLEVVLDSRLTWRNHILSVVQRVHAVMYRLRLFRRSTTFELRRHLVQAFVFPIIDYCCLVYVGLSGELSTILDRLLNYGVRFVFRLRLDEHVTAHRERLGWLRCEERRKYFLGCLTYKVLNSGVPSYLSSRFIANNSTRPMRSEVLPLVIPRRNTVTMDKSFHVSAAYFWNSLPPDIRNESCLSSFTHTIIAMLTCITLLSHFSIYCDCEPSRSAHVQLLCLYSFSVINPLGFSLAPPAPMHFLTHVPEWKFCR